MKACWDFKKNMPRAHSSTLPFPKTLLPTIRMRLSFSLFILENVSESTNCGNHSQIIYLIE